MKKFILVVLLIIVGCRSNEDNNLKLYDILINQIYENRNSKFCAACSGYYNLVNVSLYVSNEDYKIVTYEESPYYLEDTSGYSNTIYLDKNQGNVISKKSDDSPEKYTLISTYEYKDIFKDLIFWASNNVKNNNGDLLKENNSTKDEEEIEKINWSNLNLPSPLKSSIFVVESLYYGEGYMSFSGYDVVSNKNYSYDYSDLDTGSFESLNSNEGTENIDKILLELKNINSDQSNEIFQELNNLNKEDKENNYYDEGSVFGSFVSKVIYGIDEKQLPKKIKIIYDSRKSNRYSEQIIYYAENVSHNPYVSPIEQVITKNEADKLQRELGFPYTDSHTLILDGKPYYLYFDLGFGINEDASIRAYKYNDGKYPIFSGSGNIDLYTDVWNSLKSILPKSKNN